MFLINNSIPNTYEKQVPNMRNNNNKKYPSISDIKYVEM